MSNQKPRILHDYRDLIWSLLPLALIAIVFAGIASQCSFAATGPTQGPIPSFNAKEALASDAQNLPFPIREPALPEEWTPNSGSRETIGGAGGGKVSTVGYISPEGTYLQLNQSAATEETLVRHFLSTRYPSGSRQIGGHTWVVYSEPDAEPGWVADFGAARILIRGAGDDAAFTTLAQAVTAATPSTPVPQ